MSDFQRSPSKVWWPDEYPNLSRNFSASPGSQDSGFSDTENSPTAQAEQRLKKDSTPKKQTPTRCIPKDILKDVKEEDALNSQNLSVNFKHKITPQKNIALKLAQTEDKNRKNATYYLLGTPRTDLSTVTERKVRSEPTRKHRFHRNDSLKVNRSLFKNENASNEAVEEEIKAPHQYSRPFNTATELQSSNTNCKTEQNDSNLWKSDYSSVELPTHNTCPVTNNIDNLHPTNHNQSAPAILENCDPDGILSTNEESLESSSCESELESAFHGLTNNPNYTSTPKVSIKTVRNMQRLHRCRRVSQLSLASEDDRVPPLSFREETKCVQKWLQEARELYEPECMATLQSKSIAAELNQKVSSIASKMTGKLRRFIADSDMIILEFDNIQRDIQQEQEVLLSIRNLTTLIERFLQNYITDTDVNLLKICDEIRNSSEKDISGKLSQLNSKWKILYNKTSQQEVQHLVNELVDPHSELHVRAALTGLTSIILRNQLLTDIFISCNTVQILCVLCEKCESSTVRSLILRALSTVCANTTAIRHLENASAISIIVDVISEESRPEPERSEAVALLAQITAPWIEDNRSVQGLNQHIKPLVKALTHFVSTTKCCQNLLLCTAALANLTEMEPKTTKYVLYQNSVKTILNAIKTKTSLVSIYLLEQVATLIANLSLKPTSHKLLVEYHAPAALLHFLHCNHSDSDVEARLQQKSVIALSRLSTEPVGARQIVKLNGVSRLVKLCRDRKERHDSDAVLVASLATLRKIAEVCGNDVIDSLDVQELIEPRLLDSFLAYSTQTESYV